MREKERENCFEEEALKQGTGLSEGGSGEEWLASITACI